MLTRDFAADFARDWIDSWNAHDLDRILAHYTDDFEMTTPYIVSLMSVPSGTLKGKDKIRDYWTKALAGRPQLNFKWFFFNGAGKAALSPARHDEILIAN
jgi:ketosteroid isomerase-like protein